MKTIFYATWFPALLLAGCGGAGATLDGPLTQDKLNEIQSGCGMTAAKLVSATPGEKVKITVDGLTLDASDETGVNLIMQAKCLQSKLSALGVDHDVTAPMISSDMDQQINDAIKNAPVN
jgi:hypothetical protein